MPLNFDWNTLILGLLATCLFAECIVLILRVSHLKNKMEAQAESIRTSERLDYEKKLNQKEMLLKESELEIKAEYEEMLLLAKNAKREQDEKLAEINVELENARAAGERAAAESEAFGKMRVEAESARDGYLAKISELAGGGVLDMNAAVEEAKRIVLQKCLDDLAPYKKEVLEKSKREIDDNARRMLMDAMQRVSVQMPQSATATFVKIPDEAMKGRLIGKEGRNIRSFENETATTLVIDESPETVVVSSFNPVRRAVAKLALESLVADGRITPITIEQAVASARAKISQNLHDLGEETIAQFGIASTSDELKSALGELSVHLSLNQDTLAHSIEVAKLSAFIASELGCDADIAARAGLFHDIGKGVRNANASHAVAGAELLRRAGESKIVVNAVESHHGEVPAESVYAIIVQIADSISATRVGARMEAVDGYIKRIKTLESLAREFDGVANAYVLQAGRELRVIVSPELVDDVRACELVSKIREKIESTITNSIPVKITLIRERRWTETAKA